MSEIRKTRAPENDGGGKSQRLGFESSDIELLALAKQVVNDNDVRFCPHGRPVMIELSKYELEKQFGRV